MRAVLGTFPGPAIYFPSLQGRRCPRAVGHTEASVDLARLAGLKPAGVICEIMREDGSMARLPDLEEFAEKHGLKIVSVADLIKYKMRNEKFVRRVVETRLPTRYGGDFKLVAYENDVDAKTHLAFVKGILILMMLSLCGSIRSVSPVMCSGP